LKKERAATGLHKTQKCCNFREISKNSFRGIPKCFLQALP